MIINKKHIYLSLLMVIPLTAFFLSAFGQSEKERGLPLITNYKPDVDVNILSKWSIIEDNDGIMYFGNGSRGKTNILEYDGVNWTAVQCPPSPPVIRMFAKDKNGRIYYGSWGDFGYLDKDSVGRTYEHSLLEFVPKEKRSFSDVWSTCVTPDGIYFQSRERLFRLAKNSSSWTVKTWEPATHFMYAFYLDGVLYVNEQNRGLYKMDHDSLALIPGSEFLGQDRMQVMLPFNEKNATGNQTASKQYLIGTFTHGMFVFDGKNFRPFKSEIDNLIKKYLLYKGVLIDGNYLLSLFSYGLVIINPQGKIVQEINQANSNLTSNNVIDIYPDSHGSVWLALENGISKLELHSPFTYFNAQNGISSIPLSIARTSDGALYVGTNSSLLQFNPVTSKFETNNLIPHNQIFSLLPDGNTLLVSDNGLYMIKKRKVILVRPSVSDNLKIYTLIISKKNPDVLFAGTTFGVSVFIRDTTTVKGWKYLGSLPGLAANVRSFAEDQSGNVWATDTDGQIYRITLSVDNAGIPDIAKTLVEKFGKEQGIEHPIAGVISLNNKLYFPPISTDSAACTFNESSNRFEETGFQGIPVLGAVEDSTGKVWITTGSMDHAKYIIATPGPDGKYQLDSTSLLHITDPATIYPDRNNIVWFLGSNGLIRYDQKIKSDIAYSYKTLIRSVVAENRKLNPDATGNNFLSIRFNSNSLRFDYAAPFYDQEDRTEYQTWLKGFEKTWSAWGKNPYKEYTNLSPGKYTFHVRAKNIYQKLSEEASYSFTILPPWYRTWWAYLTYAALVIGLMWLIIHLRSRKLQKEKLALEEKVNDRTLELKKSLEDLKSTQSQLIQSEKMASLGELTAGIAHEIQNPLNFVNNFSDINKELIEELKTKSEELKIENTDVKDLLNDIKSNEEKISLHGKRADGIVKSMLEHSRTSTGVKEPTDINKLANEYLRLAYHGMRAKDKDFNCEMKTNFDESLQKIDVVPQDIGRVLLNLFNNAFYAVNDKQKSESNGYVPTVTLVTRKENNHVTITVTDNGSGISKKIKDKIFQPFFTTKPTGQGTGLGLSLSYDIITKEHGGTIKVESNEGVGTEFTIHLPTHF